MRPLLWVMLAVAFVAVNSRASADDAAEKKEKAKLKGTWLLTSKVTKAGTEVPFGGVHAITFQANGKLDVYVLEDDKDRKDAPCKLDPGKTPKEIEITFKGNKKAYGIYELKGKVLKICFSTTDANDRPQKFDGTADGVTLWELTKK